ncbi:MAG TPA: cellulose binding domain-containing protein [Polyangiaceae bacterium]|nr:cellulose binding domain-containing protein [Polyangiaceae bacterium]
MRPAAWAWRLLCGASLLAACAHPEDELEAPDDTPPVAHGGSGGASAGKGGKSASSGTAAVLGGAGPADVPHAGSAGKGGAGGSAGTAGQSGAGGSGGKSHGGAGGAAGSSGAAGVTNTGGAPPAGALEVDYKCGNSSATDNQIRSSLRIKSMADASVAISGLELRYYFTSEVALPLTVEIYDASVDGAAGYHAVSHDAVKAEITGTDGYLELTFTQEAGALSKGSALTLDVAVHGPNWTGNFSEADDYSFAADHADFAPWDHVTLFAGGELVWGKEP